MTLLITINNPSTVSGHGQQHEIIVNRHVIKRTVAALPMSLLSIAEELVAYDFLLVFFRPSFSICAMEKLQTSCARAAHSLLVVGRK